MNILNYDEPKEKERTLKHLALLRYRLRPSTYFLGMDFWKYTLWTLSPIIDFIAKRFRPLAMIIVVLPVSFVLRKLLWLRDTLHLALYVRNGKLQHTEKVKRVQNMVQKRAALPAPARKPLCTARAPWNNLSTRFNEYKHYSQKIDVSDFRSILELNTDELTVTIEPLVTVQMITRYLLPKGYILATTLEIEEATVGGLAMAVGMTTASHKEGLLQETVLEYEILLGNGEIVNVTKDNQYSDLYYALPWAHGSLGLLLSLKLRIIPASKYVKVTYTPMFSKTQYCEYIRELACRENPPQFIEATVFSKEKAVVMQGDFVTSNDGELSMEEKKHINHLGSWYKPWFYTHVREYADRAEKEQRLGGHGASSLHGGVTSHEEEEPHPQSFVEYVPTYEYIFRHNRAIFWTLRDQLPEHIGNHWFFRWFLGWLCPPKVTILKLPATESIREEMMCRRVYQDVVLPVSEMEDSIDKSAELFDIWPLLIYPSRVYNHGEGRHGIFPEPRDAKKLLPGKSYGMYYDLGIYGIPPENVPKTKRSTARRTGENSSSGNEREKVQYLPVTSMRAMEHYTRCVGGAPFLYADTFMTREEFEEMFDLDLYTRVRAKYHAVGNFPHVFEKTSGGQRLKVWQDRLAKEKVLFKEFY